MARSKNNQRSAGRVAVDVGATGTRPTPKGAVVVLAVCILAAVWAVAMMTSPGRVAYYFFFAYAEYYMGVICLVSLSITIMVGLVATDRLVLSIRQRVLLQSAHRTTGLIAVTALVLHLWTKVVEDHARIIDVFVPFLAQYNRMYIGFGTLSAYIMVIVMWSGIFRSRFIGRGKPWMWRSIHAMSYLMWPIALTHGLSAGRPAATWVIVSYVICVLGVLVGLAVRLSVSLNRNKDFASSATGGLKPVGKLVPTTAPAPKKRSPRREPAVAEDWVPAAPPAPAPVSAAPVSGGYPRDRWGGEPEAPAPRQRRSADDFEVAGYADDHAGDPGYADEEPVARGRRRAGPWDEEPPARVRRHADEDEPRGRRGYDGEPRGRRSAHDLPDEEPAPRSRHTRYADEPAPRAARGYGEVDDHPPRGRRSDLEETGTRMQRPADTGTRMRRPEIDDTGELRVERRPRRYADADEPEARSRPWDPDDRPRRRRHAEDGGADGYGQDGYGGQGHDAGRESVGYDAGGYEAGGYQAAYDEVPRQRAARYADDEPAVRPARHSRSQFVDLAGDDYPPDDTPTLIDMASRRARRAAAQESGGARGARRGRGGRAADDPDEAYWSQMRDVAVHGDVREAN